jgi:hypothetical protein
MAREKSQESRVSRKKSADAEYSDQEARERFERAVDVAVATKPISKSEKPRRGR